MLRWATEDQRDRGLAQNTQLGSAELPLLPLICPCLLPHPHHFPAPQCPCPPPPTSSQASTASDWRMFQFLFLLCLLSANHTPLSLIPGQLIRDPGSAFLSPLCHANIQLPNLTLGASPEFMSWSTSYPLNSSGQSLGLPLKPHSLEYYVFKFYSF